MNSYKKSKPRIISVIALSLILAILLSMASIGMNKEPLKVYAGTLDYYELKVGDKSVATFTTEEDAYEVITRLKDKYVDDSTEAVVKLTPALTVETVSLPKYGEQPVIDSDKSVVIDNLLETQEVQEVIGEQPQEQASEQLVNVTIEYTTTEEESIPFETVYQEDAELYVDEEYILQYGAEGVSEVTYRIVEVNGSETVKEEVARETTLEPVEEIVVYGTMEYEEEVLEEETAEYTEEETEYTEEESEEYYEEETEEAVDTEDTSESEEEISPTDNQDETFDESVGDTEVSVSETSYSGSGQDVVNYAMQFIGNPYVWGGISLTNGCDCSGFVYSVFNDCGYSINRWPDDDFPHVSASELKPGDVCRYGGHYAIYIGNGMEISAVNEEQGIRTHPMYYSRSAFMYGIRIID